MKRKYTFFHKYGILFFVLISLLILASCLLPTILLPNINGELVSYNGIDVALGKDIGAILFNGYYKSKAEIMVSYVICIGYGLPMLLTLIAIFIKNRRIKSIMLASGYIVSIVILMMINEIGMCHLYDFNLLTSQNELFKHFKDIDGVLQYGPLVACLVAIVGIILSIPYAFSDYMLVKRKVKQ